MPPRVLLPARRGRPWVGRPPPWAAGPPRPVGVVGGRATTARGGVAVLCRPPAAGLSDRAAGVWAAVGPGRLWAGGGTTRVFAAAAGPRVWSAGGPVTMADELVRNTLTETAGFTGLRYYLDCGDVREVAAGDAISSVVVTADAGVTVASSRVETGGYRVSAVLACSAAGDYTVTFVMTLQSGATFTRRCTLHAT